ncbi:phenoloxidase-activating factor 2-like [Planococcus citri]|uniref:phenoloxidase-activating factor 2-like n=1 Tax=Planococcus citri TaxID=170843 RepID=UPI0031F7A240
MYGPSVVSVLVLVSSIGIAIAATTSNPSTVKSSSRSAVASARSATNNSTRKVVTFRQNFGSVDEQCTCVVFHLCDNDKVVSVPNADGQERCSGDEVCCKGDSPPVPPPTDPPPTPPPSSTGINCNDACICVPFWQCIDYQLLPVVPQTDEENFENVANPRFRCEPPDFCCPPCNISRNTTLVTDLTTISPPTPTPYIDIPSQPSTEVRLPTSTESGAVSPVPTEQECGVRGKTSVPNEDNIDDIINAGVRIQNKNETGDTEFGEFPWMVALFKTNDYSTNGEVICGASLLSPFIVLTAAHCVNKIDMHSLRVRVGEYNIGSDEKETLPHQDRTVNAVHIHPNYNPKRLFNDLALLSVNEPFVYDSHINGICAPLVGTPYAEKHAYNAKSCWAAGWGKGNFTDKTIQHKLKKVELPIVEFKNCQERLQKTKLGTGFTLDSSFLCAGGQKGFDACKGDGGGPLFCTSRKNEHKLIQVGVVSWGVGCGNDIPGIYASLEANSEWLTTEINTMSVFRPGS